MAGPNSTDTQYSLVRHSRRRAATLDAPDICQYLVFQLGGELYGTDVRGVREILPFGRIDSVPGMSGYLRGVIDLNGVVVPVIDLETRLGGRRGTSTALSCILLLRIPGDEGNHNEVGVVVDAAWQIGQISARGIVPCESPPDGVHGDHVLGSCRCDDRRVTILDLPRLALAEPALPRRSVAGKADRCSLSKGV